MPDVDSIAPSRRHLIMHARNAAHFASPHTHRFDATDQLTNRRSWRMFDMRVGSYVGVPIARPVLRIMSSRAA